MILTCGIFQLKTSQMEWKQLNHFLNEWYSWPIVMVPGVGGFICFTDGWWRWRFWLVTGEMTEMKVTTSPVSQTSGNWNQISPTTTMLSSSQQPTSSQQHCNHRIIFVINHLFTVNFIISANTSIKRNILSIKTRYCYTIELYFKNVKLSGRKIVK